MFILNQIERRYVMLTEKFLEYQQSKEALLKQQATIDIGYVDGNYMVSLGWDIVDWCERLRKVLHGLAGVRNKEKWLQDLRAALKPIEEVRNFLQHYDKEMKRFIIDLYPLMGGVCACFPIEDGWHTVYISCNPVGSAIDKGTTLVGFQVPSSIVGEVDYITFAIAEHYLNLSGLMRHLRTARSDYRSYLESEYNFVWPEF